MPPNMKVSLIPNDFSMDLEAVFKMCNAEHVQYVELGYMWNKSILDLTPEEIQNVLALMKQYNLKAASIQTQIMKVGPPGSILDRKGSQKMNFDYSYNRSRIDRAIEVAEIFDTPFIVSYSYFRHGVRNIQSYWPKLLADYEEFLPKLKAKNKTMVIECEPDTLIATVQDYLKIFKYFDSPHIAANLDLANLHGGQKSFSRADFEAIFPYVKYFHVKDRRKKLIGATGAIFGEGFIPWSSVLPWFAEKGFDGYLSVEPHVHGENRFEKGVQCVRNLQNLLKLLKIAFI